MIGSIVKNPNCVHPPNVVNETRYVARADNIRGVVTLHWKENEKDDHIGKFLLAREALEKRKTTRVLTYSCSATLSMYTREQCITRLMMWSQWHENWVYGAVPTVRLTEAMPLRPGTGTPKPGDAQQEVGEAYGHYGPANQREPDDLFEVCATFSEGEELNSVTDPLPEQTSDLSSKTSLFSNEGSDTDSAGSDTEELR